MLLWHFTVVYLMFKNASASAHMVEDSELMMEESCLTVSRTSTPFFNSHTAFSCWALSCCQWSVSVEIVWPSVLSDACEQPLLTADLSWVSSWQLRTPDFTNVLDFPDQVIHFSIHVLIQIFNCNFFHQPCHKCVLIQPCVIVQKYIKINEVLWSYNRRLGFFYLFWFSNFVFLVCL